MIEGFKFVTPENINSIESYAGSIAIALISLNTLSNFGKSAARAGFLQTDEEERAKTVEWEIRRLMKLYQGLLEEILERTDLSIEQINASLHSLNQPKITKSKKKIYKKEAEIKT